MAIYIFDTTKGAGVPGLPHVISDEEAEAQGLTELLLQAIENGLYSEQKTEGSRQQAEGNMQKAEGE